MASAMGKPVFAWSSHASGLYAHRAHGFREDGWQVEEFGLTDNLMVVKALAAPVFSSPQAALTAIARHWHAAAGARPPPKSWPGGSR